MRGVSRDTQSVALVQITAGTIACERDKIARRMPALRRCSGCPRPKTRKSTLDLQRTHSRCIRKPWQATYSWQTPRLGPVAQRLEQGTHNPLVGGSNPSGPTRLTDDSLRECIYRYKPRSDPERGFFCAIFPRCQHVSQRHAWDMDRAMR